MIYPEIPATYWSFKYAMSFIGKKASLPPLGLLTVAALLPKTYDIKLIDMNVAALTKADIKAADIVFISAMIVQKHSFEQVVTWCRECNIPVVAGGPYPSSSYEKIEGVDYFILNEAEITLPRFLEDYEHGCPRKIYLDEQKPDITKTPPPRFDLLDVHIYSSLALQFSRGCPFSCEFCDIIDMFGRNPRTKSPEQFVAEMECVYQTGFSGSVFIVDDNFFGNKQKVKELLVKMIEWQKAHGYPFSFFTEASINCASDTEFMDLMAEAGFDMVFIGIETPHRETLEKIAKKQNLHTDVYADIEKLQRRGIEVSGGFVLGFDSDPDNIFDLQIDFIQKAGIPMAMVGLLNALPNTQLYRRLQQENRLVNDSSGNNTHDLKLNFLPRMSRKVLLEGYKRVISEIYTPKKYFDRCFTLLKRLPSARKVYRPVKLAEVRALILSLCKQTFSPYGFYYLRFLWRALRYNYKLFAEAMALAVKGYHLFRITQEILQAEEFSKQLDISLQSFQEELAEILKKWNVRIAREMEHYGTQIKAEAAKKYHCLNQGMQHYLSDAYTEFAVSCESTISEWKQRVRQTGPNDVQLHIANAPSDAQTDASVSEKTQSASGIHTAN
jgi:radical SAM superfamily enzyme YgiQ (UPF0313 family)